jgi:hypothetical protein
MDTMISRNHLGLAMFPGEPGAGDHIREHDVAGAMAG